MDSSATSGTPGTTPSDQPVTKPLEFSGKGGEFFGIWIVNLLLSILTLGIYSAWAKVRTKQYFYGHTRLDGHRFRYLAKPLQILRGRIIAFAVFVVYSLSSAYAPSVFLTLSLLFVFLMPWLVIQGLRFNLRMTSYRNVRFSFKGTYGDAFVNMLLLPVVGALTLYLAMPWVLKKIDQFMHGNITYGGKQVQLNTRAGQYYLAAMAALGTAIALMIAVAVASALGVGFSVAVLSSDTFNPALIVTYVLILVIYWVAFSIVAAVYQSMVRNHLLESAEIPGVASFRSRMQVIPYAMLMLTNSLLVIVTLGFGYPFAKVRKAAYLSQVTEVCIQPGAYSLIDAAEKDPSAFGEESAEFFDIDLSLT